jgi:hypothetical protein
VALILSMAQFNKGWVTLIRAAITESSRMARNERERISPSGRADLGVDGRRRTS